MPPIFRIFAAGHSGEPDHRMFRSILAASLCRILLNTARRFAYPFAPVLSRGLDVPLTAVTSMIAVNQATGVLGMLFGPLADRFGYRLMMMTAMGLLVAGMLASGLLPLYGVVLIGLFLAGLGKNVFDPAIQAYAGEHIAFERRGLVIGVLEFSWAGSTLIGVPLIGLLIDRYGWRSPFFALAAAGLLGLLALMLTVSGDRPRSFIRPARACGRPGACSCDTGRLSVLWASFFSSVPPTTTCSWSTALGWNSRIRLSVVALGLGTGMIGLAELVGEFLTAILADRIGLKSAVGGGCWLRCSIYLILPFAGRIFRGLAGLFVVFLVFEFTMVCFLSLSTELMPSQRATMMYRYLAAAGLGRVLGALIGGPVWMAGGITGNRNHFSAVQRTGARLFLWGFRGWRPA